MDNTELQIGNVVTTYYMGEYRTCRITGEATHRTAKMRERWVWLEVIGDMSMTEYHRRFMKPMRILQRKIPDSMKGIIT